MTLCSPALFVADAIPPNGGELMDAVRRVQEADLDAWRRYSFHREVVRQRLSPDAAVLQEEMLAFDLMPTTDGYDEELIRIDGRVPLTSETRSHRRAQRFTKHYRQAKTGDASADDEGFSLLRLMHFENYRLVGRETVDGTACYRLDFGPTEGFEHDVLSEFATAMAGSLWIAEDSMHIARAEARTLRPIRLSFGLIRILTLTVEVETAPVEGGVWLPRRIGVSSTLSVLGKRIRKRNTFTYSQYVQMDMR